MKLRITPAEVKDREELRTLLIDAADELIGENSQVLEAKLPWDGHPILLADADQHPVLVSFDPEQGQTALLNGLRAAEQLTVALPWINQVYDALEKRQQPPKLVIVSREPPPGDSLLSSCPHLRMFEYRILRINGETGIWLESGNSEVTAAAPSPEPPLHAPSPVVAVKDRDPGVLPSLSDEENNYFRQL